MGTSFDTRVVHIISGKNKTNNRGDTEIERAKQIAKTLGIKCAARYLAIREWSVESALFILLGKA